MLLMLIMLLMLMMMRKNDDFYDDDAKMKDSKTTCIGSTTIAFQTTAPNRFLHQERTATWLDLNRIIFFIPVPLERRSLLKQNAQKPVGPLERPIITPTNIPTCGSPPINVYAVPPAIVCMHNRMSTPTLETFPKRGMPQLLDGEKKQELFAATAECCW